MPHDDPQVGEVWSANSQEGSAAVLIVAATNDAVQAVGREGRRFCYPKTTLLRSREFLSQQQPTSCSTLGCGGQAWFYQAAPDGFAARCYEHINPNFWVNFSRGTKRVGPLEECPSCNSTVGYPGSFESVREEFVHHVCGQCRHEWAAFVCSDKPESVLALGEHISDFTNELELRHLKVEIVLIGRRALDRLKKAVGTFGTTKNGTPTFLGIPLITTNTYGPHTAVVVGSEIVSVRPAREAPTGTFTNSTGILVGQLWWDKKTWEKVYVIDVNEEGVRIRHEGQHDILPIETFQSCYSRTPPPPPCQEGEEWEGPDGGLVKIVEVEDDQAMVLSPGGRFRLLHFSKFPSWRRVERTTLYERINADEVVDG